MNRPMLLRAVPVLLLAGACRSAEPTSAEDSAHPEVEQVVDDATAAQEPADTIAGDTNAALGPEVAASPTPTTLAYGDARGRLPELVAAALSPDGQALVGVSPTGAI